MFTPVYWHAAQPLLLCAGAGIIIGFLAGYLVGQQTKPEKERPSCPPRHLRLRSR